MERPNTVAGLIDKRRQTLALLRQPYANIDQLSTDIAALDHVMALFGAKPEGRALIPKRPQAPHTAAKGEMQCLVLDMIRRAGAPVTSPQIAVRYCVLRGLQPEGDVFANIKTRVISRLTKLKATGIVQKVVIGGRYRGWTLADNGDPD